MTIRFQWIEAIRFEIQWSLIIYSFEFDFQSDISELKLEVAQLLGYPWCDALHLTYTTITYGMEKDTHKDLEKIVGLDVQKI